MLLRRWGGGKVRFRLSQHLKILLFIAGEPQKLDRQRYISLESPFHKLFKIQVSDTLEVLVKLLKLYPDWTGFLPQEGRGCPHKAGCLPETFASPEIWSENNRNFSITKDICTTIDFAPLKKFLEESQLEVTAMHFALIV